MLARVALGRQIKERQGWVDQADLGAREFRRRERQLRCCRRVPYVRRGGSEIERAWAHLRKPERLTKRATSSWELTAGSSGTRRTEKHALCRAWEVRRVWRGIARKADGCLAWRTALATAHVDHRWLPQLGHAGALDAMSPAPHLAFSASQARPFTGVTAAAEGLNGPG
jgi:hypothetical protein